MVNRQQLVEERIRSTGVFRKPARSKRAQLGRDDAVAKLGAWLCAKLSARQLKVIYSNMRSDAGCTNKHGSRKVLKMFFKHKLTEESLVAFLLSADWPTRELQDKKREIERLAIEKATNTIDGTECPRCKEMSLHVRTWNGAEMGGCGGKAVLRSEESCVCCGYCC